MKSKTPKLAPPPLLAAICRALDEMKTGDLRVLCVRQQSSITDYLVLGTGTSEPHLRSLRVEIEKVLDEAKARIVGMDTGDGSGWLVVDAFDIMVHIFTQENRRKYALDSLWKDAEEVPLASLLAPGAKLAPPAKTPRPARKIPVKAKAKAKAPAKAKVKVKAKTKAKVKAPAKPPAKRRRAS
jgi:ribosome-associated protein